MAHKVVCAEKIRHQAKIAMPDVTEEELNKLVSLENTDSLFIASMIQNGRAHAKAKNALNFIEHQRSELEALESSLIQLRNTFFDVHLLVHTQGEKLDNVTEEISHAEAATRAAVVELGKAEQSVSSKRNRRCCCCCCLGATALGAAGAGAGALAVSAGAFAFCVIS